MCSVNISHLGALTGAEQGRGTRAFFRHALEMTVAMILGADSRGVRQELPHRCRPKAGLGGDQPWATALEPR
jgi:hypothetical protein